MADPYLVAIVYPHQCPLPMQQWGTGQHPSGHLMLTCACGHSVRSSELGDHGIIQHFFIDDVHAVHELGHELMFEFRDREDAPQTVILSSEERMTELTEHMASCPLQEVNN